MSNYWPYAAMIGFWLAIFLGWEAWVLWFELRAQTGPFGSYASREGTLACKSLIALEGCDCSGYAATAVAGSGSVKCRRSSLLFGQGVRRPENV